MLSLFKALWQDESGISSVEYALLLAFIGGAIVLSADLLGDAVANEMDEARNCIENGANPDGSCISAG